MIVEILKLILGGPFEFISFMILLATIHMLFQANINTIITLYFTGKKDYAEKYFAAEAKSLAAKSEQ